MPKNYLAPICFLGERLANGDIVSIFWQNLFFSQKEFAKLHPLRSGLA
jgi:hypothetical protein